jgi:hypothetical protein
MSPPPILATALTTFILAGVPAAADRAPAGGGAEPDAIAAAGHVVPASEPPPIEAYLAGGRFRLLANWQTAGDAGDAVPLPLTVDTAAFWFFRPDNLELMVKVLDGCQANQRFWVFAAGLTDVGVELTVEDTVAGVSRSYPNAGGAAFPPVQDTAHFSTCDQQRACGRGTAEELAATPRQDRDTEWMALVLGRRLTAPEALYARLTADLAAIAALEPIIPLIGFYGLWIPNSLVVEFDRASYDAIAAGTYGAWDCLNDWYGVIGISPINAGDESGSVGLRFDRLLHPDLVGPDYEALPGALSSRRLDSPPPPPFGPLLQCAEIEGNAIHYYFQILGQVWYATSPALGQVPESVESFDLELPTLPPPWVEDLQRCRQLYARS